VRKFFDEYKGYIIIILISILISFISAILISSNSQSYITHWLTTHENNATQVFPGEGLNFKNYKVAGNSFIALNNDPQIYVELDEKNARYVSIGFSEPLNQDINISIYYANEKQGFSQKRVVSMTGYKGKNVFNVELPNIEHSKLRIDIGNKPDIQFNLGSINIIKNVRLYKYINPLFIVSVLISFGLICICLLYFKENIKLENKYRNIFFSSFIISCLIWIIKNIKYSSNLELSIVLRDIIGIMIVICIVLIEFNILFPKAKNRGGAL